MSAESAVRRSVVAGDSVADLQAWTSEVEAWPAGSHVWGHYAERTETGEAICRTENVSACHAGFRSLVSGELSEVAASALGEAVVDFKDKVNYKQPGGAGFSPHQDLAAYPGASKVMSILVAIDECTMESGCLWVAEDVDSLLPVDSRGVVRDEIVESLSWSPVELAPGDALCISGHLVHRSEKNRSLVPRRVLVASYSAVSDGYTREGYYSARKARMDSSTAADGQFRISTLADFEGVEVRSPGAGAAHGTGADGADGVANGCTHS
ncbi:MAG: phytanoyl-CoA dioxygenase family protein [Acidimicrobiales bacterium]